MGICASKNVATNAIIASSDDEQKNHRQETQPMESSLMKLQQQPNGVAASNECLDERGNLVPDEAYDTAVSNPCCPNFTKIVNRHLLVIIPWNKQS
jgi:hypothetical protein